MAGCCESECGLNPASDRQRRTLRIVLVINAVMFAVIVAGAAIGNSSSLLADSLDNLGDALTYGFSLYAVSKAATTKAKVALFKGGLILAVAMVVAGSVGYRVLYPGLPGYETMGIFSIAGLVANSICLALLWRHRSDDINMSSVWECSRTILPRTCRFSWPPVLSGQQDRRGPTSSLLPLWFCFCLDLQLE